MNDLDERQLSAAMRGATDRIQLSPGFVSDVRQGGARRLRRRRLGVTAGAAALLLAGVTGVQAVRSPVLDRTQTFAVADPYGPWVEGPARGDLADDRSYAARVLRAWDDSHDDSVNKGRGIFDDLRGDPWVAWAGTTSAGPAALVAQKAFLHEHSDLQIEQEGITTLLGFVGVNEDGAPVVVGDTYPAPGVPPITSWFVDEERRVVATVGEGSGMGLSVGWQYGRDGSVRREYLPMPDREGVHVVELPGGTRAARVLVGVQPFRGAADVRSFVNPVPDDPGQDPDRRLPWTQPSPGVSSLENTPLLALDDSGECGTADRIEGVRGSWDVADLAVPEGYTSMASSLWFACGRLPDGRRVIAGERQVDSDPSRAIVVLRGPGSAVELVDGGPIDPTAVLPVVVRLPGVLGWVVADYRASLRYRSVTGAWSKARLDAASVPAETTLVEVTRPGAQPVVVELAARSSSEGSGMPTG